MVLKAVSQARSDYQVDVQCLCLENKALAEVAHFY